MIFKYPAILIGLGKRVDCMAATGNATPEVSFLIKGTLARHFPSNVLLFVVNVAGSQRNIIPCTAQ
jgi:hypothetical protein